MNILALCMDYLRKIKEFKNFTIISKSVNIMEHITNK